MGDLKHPETSEEAACTRLDRLEEPDSSSSGYGAAADLPTTRCSSGFSTYGDPLMHLSVRRGRTAGERAGRPARTSCLRRSWARCATSTTASIPSRRSSSPLAAYAPVGCGLPSSEGGRRHRRDQGLLHLRGRGPVRGRAGRTRRPTICARRARNTARPPDVPAAWRGWTWWPPATARLLQGATELALTKMDVLSYLDEIPVCVAYEATTARRIDRFPYTPDLYDCKPVYEVLPGWKMRHLRLPQIRGICPPRRATMWSSSRRTSAARSSYVSVGAERDSAHSSAVRKGSTKPCSNTYETPLNSRYASPEMQ